MKTRFLALKLLILSLGLSLIIFFYPYDQIKVEKVIINQGLNNFLVANIYTPKLISQPLPVVIVCHGIGNSKEMMTSLGVEIARGGMSAIAFDFGGFGESYRLTNQEKSLDNLEQSTLKDAQSVLSYIKSNPSKFNLNYVGIVGHSLGGTTALDLGKIEQQLKATVVMSMGGTASLNVPQNLLFAVGFYEQLNPPSKIKEFLGKVTEKNCNLVNNTCGDFKLGNARELFISPSSDHIIAPYDYTLTEKIVNWLQQSFNLQVSNHFFVIPWFVMGIIVSFVMGILLVVEFLLNLTPQANQQLLTANGVSNNKANKCQIPNTECQKRQFTLCNCLLIIIIYCLDRFEILTDLVNLLIVLLLVTVISNYSLNNINHYQAKFKIGFLYLILALFIFLIPGFLLATREIIQQPESLLSFPKFLIQWLIFIPYNYLLRLKVDFFPSYTFNLSVSWLFWGILLTELFFPSFSLNLVEKIGVKIVKWIRQPFRLGLGNISRREIIILGILLSFLTFSLYQRLGDGLLLTAFSMGSEVLRLFVMMILLPLFLIICIIRSRWLQNLENKTIKSHF